jgi:hypothetical protein
MDEVEKEEEWLLVARIYAGHPADLATGDGGGMR